MDQGEYTLLSYSSYDKVLKQIDKDSLSSNEYYALGWNKLLSLNLMMSSYQANNTTVLTTSQ